MKHLKLIERIYDFRLGVRDPINKQVYFNHIVKMSSLFHGTVFRRTLDEKIIVIKQKTTG